MAQVVMVTGGRGPAKRWDASCFDCCAAGCCTVLYTIYCPCCAAGDVATAAGRDYCCTCCLVPTFLGCCLPCQLNNDRAALAVRFNIDDDLGGCCACLLFSCGCHCCLLLQELNQIRVEKLSQPGGSVIMVQQPMQQVMQQGYYPAQQQQQQQYAPQQGGQYQQQGYQQPQPQQYAYQPPPPPSLAPTAPPQNWQ